MLVHAAGLLAPGGTLVYSTCTTEPEEDEDVVRRSLDRCPGFSLEKIGADRVSADLVTPEGFFRSFPHRHGMDGFFAAIMRRE
jgi:16S rRNA (cytosine967-C5)-methyltransferase